MDGYPKIFVNNNKDITNSYINYRLSNYDTYKQFENLSEGYLQVAIKDLLWLDNNNMYYHADIEIFPILFLINHSIECKLKSLAFIYKIENAKKGHNISQLLDNVLSKTINLDLQFTQYYINTFKEEGWFKESPQLDITRYPISNKNDIYCHSIENDKNIQISIHNLLLISYDGL
ncbi:hypothetical protein LOQ69_14615 [Staphylococcus aureus]